MATTLPVVLALSLTACSATWGASHRSTIRAANAIAGSVAAVTLAADWCQTRTAAAGWGTRVESGMVTSRTIGSQPSQGAVDAYFAITAAVLVAGSRALPERYRWLGYAAVAGVEAQTAIGNLGTTRCGPIGGWADAQDDAMTTRRMP